MAVGSSKGRYVPSPTPSEHSSSSSESSTLTPASSASTTSQTKFPIEVLTQILSYVGFADLYSTCQYVNSAWQFVVTRMILGNAVFIRTLIQTDYQRLLTTASGADEDTMQDSRAHSRDDTWQGVALDLSTIGAFEGLLDSAWRGKNGRKLYLTMREAYSAPESPYTVRCDLYTYKEQHNLDDEAYFALMKLSIDQRRPVLLDVVDFTDHECELHLDLSDCYRAIYWDYRRSLKELAKLTEYLEAHLWAPWCHKNAKYWGKKPANMFKEGMFVDLVEKTNERMECLYGDLETVFQIYDLHDRKVCVYRQISLHNLSRRRELNFDHFYRSLPASWDDPKRKRSVARIDCDTSAISTHHLAHFENTLDLMMRGFKWTTPGNLAHEIMSVQEYESMLRGWHEKMTVAWKQTHTVKQTIFTTVGD